LKDGETAAAMEFFERALKLDPAYAPAHYQKGLALLRLGKKDEAQVAFTEAQKLDRRLRPPKQ
jgi:Flp pilus assembly protein TadD